MPKVKTSSAAAKRFKVGGTGTVKRKQAFKSHNTAKKSAKRVRQLRATKLVSSANIAAVRRMVAPLLS